MKSVVLGKILILSFIGLNTLAYTLNAQTVKRFFYRDSVIALEYWRGADKKMDSIKAYHKTGALDEVFYLKQNKFHGNAYKYDILGKKITTWTFKNGMLLNRLDHSMEYNEKNEQKVKETHKRLREILKDYNPKSYKNRFRIAQVRSTLGNRILAMQDLRWLIARSNNINVKNKTKTPSKLLGSLYDRLSWNYAHFEIDNFASHFKYKAFRSDPKNMRLAFNLGAYLYETKSYEPARFFLNLALEKWPKHEFSHKVLAAMESDFENYEKAKYHIDIAFQNEEGLIKYGNINVERDLRTLRGYIQHKLGYSDEGIADLNEAINLNFKNTFAHRNLGVVYYDLGNYKLACKHLQLAKDLGYEKIHDRYDLENYLKASCEEVKLIELTHLNTKPFVYPNPTTGKFSIKNIPYDSFEYKVFDYSGKLVTHGSSQNKDLNITELPTGVYVLNTSANNASHTYRVVKE